MWEGWTQREGRRTRIISDKNHQGLLISKGLILGYRVSCWVDEWNNMAGTNKRSPLKSSGPECIYWREDRQDSAILEDPNFFCGKLMPFKSKIFSLPIVLEDCELFCYQVKSAFTLQTWPPPDNHRHNGFVSWVTDYGPSCGGQTEPGAAMQAVA